jgi:hypothetical protein
MVLQYIVVGKDPDQDPHPHQNGLDPTRERTNMLPTHSVTYPELESTPVQP